MQFGSSLLVLLLPLFHVQKDDLYILLLARPALVYQDLRRKMACTGPQDHMQDAQACRPSDHQSGEAQDQLAGCSIGVACCRKVAGELKDAHRIVGYLQRQGNLHPFYDLADAFGPVDDRRTANNQTRAGEV